MTSSLTELALRYFKKKGYKIEQDVSLEGFSGLTRKFDILIKRGDERRVVWVKDWKRTVGVNMVINIDKASTDVGMSRPIIISDKFSGHAKAYANRRGITLITKREILRYLR
ncbi:restriction endonuclease [Candidatus Bathyarchaeota archaeon]|nr:restriction endonuclease [Candidatus Bathyarchaeota archaeon]